MLDDVAKGIVNEAKNIAEKMLIDDIIYIYEHPLISYNSYIKEAFKYNENCIKKVSDLKPESWSMTFTYSPQRMILSKEVFDYIEELGIKKISFTNKIQNCPSN